MKRMIVFIFVFTNITLFAKQIDVNRAKNVGENFLTHKTDLRIKKSMMNLQLVYRCTSEQKSIEDETYYYVFNVDEKGFVIVAGTDGVLPILAYSTESAFDPNHIPPNMAEVLNRYKREIRYVIDNNITPADKVKKQWKELTGGKVTVHKANAVSISPLLQEIKWDQAPVYNDSCPYDASAASYYNYKCPAGCVAVAMAQIIKYWGYPEHGTGSRCYVDNYDNYGSYGTLCADFEHTAYNYSLMPNKLTSSSSTAEKRAVAQLIYHCGVAVNMKYGPDGSGAFTFQYDHWIDRNDDAGNPYIDARTALERYFGYSQVERIAKSDYTETAWINVLKEQLNNWQPMLYSGRSSEGGHAFVCDGYDENDFFHFNWGWGGRYNCYAHVSSLVPEGTGTGGGNGDYTSDQEALINIKAIKDEQTLGWVHSDDYVNPKKNYAKQNFILLPDTCLKIYTNLSDWNAANIHGMGMIFDPYAKSFGLNHDPLFAQSYPYRLDTLQITSFYTLGRNGYNAAHPDTLRIYLSYYEPYSGEPSNDYRIKPLSYNPNHLVLLPNIVKTSANLQQKGDGIRPVSSNTIVVDYILTEKDTSEEDINYQGYYRYKNIKIPLTYHNATVNGFEVPAGAVTGTMVKFIPGYDYRQGDTLYYGLVSGNQWENGYPVYVNNRYGIVYLEDTNAGSGDFFDYYGYNGVNFELQQLRYQQFHSYQDSCYYASEKYIPSMAFHLSYDIAPTHARLQIDTVVCGEKYVYFGSTYNESGVYIHRFHTPAGDSIVVINLTMYEPVGEIGNIQGSSNITQAGTYNYFIDPVPNAALYQWTVSNPKWSITGTGDRISLNITEQGSAILSVKAVHANGQCESETATLSLQFCKPLATMGNIQGNTMITQAGTYTYSIAPVENAVAYQWTVSNPQWNILGSSNSTTVKLQINTASTGTLSVKATDDCGKTAQKNIAIQSSVSVSKYDESNGVHLYPNPTKDIVFVLIENHTLTNAEIHLFDIFGRLLNVQKITGRETAIKMDSFSAGVYMMQIKENQRIIKTSKIIRTE
jgi:hypothetical protein